MKIQHAIVAILFTIVIIPHAFPAQSLFRLESTIDMTIFGGNANTPMTLEFGFDSNSRDVYPFDPSATVLGNISGTLIVGSDFVQISGASIVFWDNQSSFSTTYPFPSDGFQFWAIPENRATLTGQILGKNIQNFSIRLIDKYQTMFDKKPTIPSSADFATFADLQSSFLSDGISATSLMPTTTPFRLSTVPEPSVSALFLIAGVSLQKRQSRKN